MLSRNNTHDAVEERRNGRAVFSTNRGSLPSADSFAAFARRNISPKTRLATPAILPAEGLELLERQGDIAGSSRYMTIVRMFAGICC